MKGEHFMIKKFKRWYSNLTIYEKYSFFLDIAFVLYLIIAFSISFYFCANSLGAFFYILIFALIPGLCIFPPIDYKINVLKLQSDIKARHIEAEKEVKEYFEKSDKNILEIIPKSSKGITDIIDFYYRKGKKIESYWAELDEIYGKSVLYISVICIGETNRTVYPKIITNFCYLINNFTFK